MADARFGMQLPSFSFPGSPAPLFETVKRIARNAEAAGFDSFWVMDHFYQIRGVGPAEAPMLESWLALAGIEYHIVNFADLWEEETLSLFAEAVRLAQERAGEYRRHESAHRECTRSIRLDQ